MWNALKRANTKVYCRVIHLRTGLFVLRYQQLLLDILVVIFAKPFSERQ